MPIYRGTQQIARRFRGTQEIGKIYRGTSLIWQKAAKALQIDGSTAPFVTMFVGSSTTQGQIGATDEHHNYVNQFAARLTTAFGISTGSFSPGRVEIATSGSPTRPTAAGMYWWNCGLGGTTSADYIGTNRQSLISALKPNLMVHMVGANDYRGQSISPASFKVNLQNVINDARTRSPGVQHLFVHSYPSLDVTGSPTYRWEHYGARLAELASENSDVMWVDVTDLWADRGVFLNGTDPDDLVGPDNIHATNAGYQFLAETIATKLALDLRRGEVIWRLDPEQLTAFANGAEVTSVPPLLDVLEQTTAGTGQTAGQRPTMVTAAVNGKRALQFDGTNDSLDLNMSRSYGLPVTIFLVLKLNTGGTAIRPIISRTSAATGAPADSQGYIYIFDNKAGTPLTQASFQSNAAQATRTFTVRDDQWYVMGVVFRADDNQQVYINSKVPLSSDTSLTDFGMGPWIRSLRMGSNTARASFSNMTLGYLSLMSGELTDAEIGTVMGDLGTAYGVSIYEPGNIPDPPELGPEVYSHSFTSSSDVDLATVSPWVDHAYSTGTYRIGYQGHPLVPSGIGNYRSYNCYIYNAPLARSWMWARVKISSVPASSNANGGVGLVLRHDGTSGIFFKIMTNGGWRIYHGSSNTDTATDASVLASGEVPFTVMPGMEIIVTIEGDNARFYLQNTLLNPGGTSVFGTPVGKIPGVIISMNGAGELYDFACGTMSTAPPQLASMGLTKTGSTQNVTNSASVWTRLTNWTVRSGFPGTVQSGDGIDLPAGSYKFVGHVDWSTNFSGTDQGLRIVNSSGSVIASLVQRGSDTHLEQTISWPGGVIYLEARAQSTTSSRRDVLASGTYFTFEDAS